MEFSLAIINRDGLVNTKQLRGLLLGRTVHWLCGEDTPGIRALFFAHMLPKKKHLPHTKASSLENVSSPNG